MMLANIIESFSPSFFESRGDFALWSMGAVAIVCLVFGADRVVSSAAKLAAELGLSKVIIGATIVSLGTTLPEACVSVMASFRGDSDMALGNGVGSVIVDTALIFGLCCCICRLPKDKFMLNRHGWLQLGSGALLVAVVLISWAWVGDIESVWIPWYVGIFFLLLLAFYLYLSVRWSREHPELIPDEAKEVASKDGRVVHRRPAWLLLSFLAGGLVLIVGGSELLIGSVKQICERHKVPEELIAVTVVAFGTSLPELATAIASLLKGHADLLVGNVIGADILNVLFVIGASSSAGGLDVKPSFLWLYLPMMMLVLIMLRLFIFMPGKRFSRWQGVPLLASYALFIVLIIKFGLVSG